MTRERITSWGWFGRGVGLQLTNVGSWVVIDVIQIGPLSVVPNQFVVDRLE